jgi:hypothetical protein
MLTLALIGRRSLYYGKEDMKLNGHLNRRNLIPVLILHSKGSGVLPLDKIIKMDHDNLRKVCNGKLPDKQNLDKKEAEPSESSRAG